MRAETAASDPKAVAIADQVMEALGGKAKGAGPHSANGGFQPEPERPASRWL